jgi:hypothetical protein
MRIIMIADNKLGKNGSKNPALSYLDKIEIPKHDREHDWTPLIAMLIILTVITLFGIWIYSLLPHNSNHSSVNAAAKSSNSAANNSSQGNVVKSYSSSSLNLSFNYPGSWKVADKGNGLLTVTSPRIPLVEASGKKTSGVILVTINSQTQLPSGYTSGTAVAVLDSQLINYSKPANGQSAQTYISFVQYASTTIKGGLDAIFVTGNNGYQKDQVIPTADMNNVSPLITASFNTCGNKNCSKTNPLTIKASYWSSKSIKPALLIILTSLTIQ